MTALKYWTVIWVEYELPGGFLGNKFIPGHLRPVLGQAKACYETFSNGRNAFRKIRKLDSLAYPRLFFCEGLRRSEKDITYKMTVEIEGE